jgi:flagellar basal-body rod protein FlgB
MGLETPSVPVIAEGGATYNYFHSGSAPSSGEPFQTVGIEMIDKLDASLRFHQEALNLRARRQEVLSANIANADTPNFKARDFDFGQALTQAVDRGRSAQSLSMSGTSARHLSGQAVASVDAEMMYRTPHQSSIDGNTVEMDMERVNFADNAMRYEANLTVLGSKIKSLLSAIQ